MEDIIACCGLICHTCQIYLATRQEDKNVQASMRAEIARLCNEQYGMSYTLQDITDCDGCRLEGTRLFPACNTCLIRKCARGRELDNCAHCDEYACARLEVFFSTDASARRRLEAIRNRPAA